MESPCRRKANKNAFLVSLNQFSNGVFVSFKSFPKNHCYGLPTGTSFNISHKIFRPRTVHNNYPHNSSLFRCTLAKSSAFLLFTRKVLRAISGTRDRFRMVVEWLTIDFSRAEFFFIISAKCASLLVRQSLFYASSAAFRFYFALLKYTHVRFLSKYWRWLAQRR